MPAKRKAVIAVDNIKDIPTLEVTSEVAANVEYQVEHIEAPIEVVAVKKENFKKEEIPTPSVDSKIENELVVTGQFAPKKIDTNDPVVACRMIRKHECRISGVYYKLAKNADVVLPNSVATVLSGAGVLIKK